MNWANESLGAQLVDFSSQLPGCEAINVLHEDPSTLWLSENEPPQWICILLKECKEQSHRQTAIIIQTIGWYCWHSYNTNPETVTIHVSPDGSKFKQWDSFTANSQQQHTQRFYCTPINCDIYPYIAFEVTKSFGGAQTYINNVFLYSDEVPPSPAVGFHSSRSAQDQSYVLTSRGRRFGSNLAQWESFDYHSNARSLLDDQLPAATDPQAEEVAAQLSRNSVDTELLTTRLSDALGLSGGVQSDDDDEEIDRRSPSLTMTQSGSGAPNVARCNSLSSGVPAQRGDSGGHERPAHSLLTTLSEVRSSLSDISAFSERVYETAYPHHTAIASLSLETEKCTESVRHRIVDNNDGAELAEERMRLLEGKFERLMDFLAAREPVGLVERLAPAESNAPTETEGTISEAGSSRPSGHEVQRQSSPASVPGPAGPPRSPCSKVEDSSGVVSSPRNIHYEAASDNVHGRARTSSLAEELSGDRLQWLREEKARLLGESGPPADNGGPVCSSSHSVVTAAGADDVMSTCVLDLLEARQQHAVNHDSIGSQHAQTDTSAAEYGGVPVLKVSAATSTDTMDGIDVPVDGRTARRVHRHSRSRSKERWEGHISNGHSRITEHQLTHHRCQSGHNRSRRRHQPAATDDLVSSSLPPPPALPASVTTTPGLLDTTVESELDARIAELARQLHEKVLLRMVRAAQLELLVERRRQLEQQRGARQFALR